MCTQKTGDPGMDDLDLSCGARSIPGGHGHARDDGSVKCDQAVVRPGEGFESAEFHAFQGVADPAERNAPAI